jgi:recombination protein RecA
MLDNPSPEPLKLYRRRKSETKVPFFSPFAFAMSSKTAALRSHVASALAARVVSPFEYRDRPLAETVPAGIHSVDFLTGGFPRGSLTEIYGPPCSGRTSLLISALASRTAASEVCALVDARDAFDPASAEAAGVKLKHLLWVRCRNVDQALRATDLLIQGGGFGLIALDFGDTPAQTVRYVPLQVWFRFRRAVESTPTILVVVEQESNAKTCASLVLQLHRKEARWSRTSGVAREILLPHSSGCLFDGSKSYAEMIRSRVKQREERLIQRGETFLSVGGNGADFEMQAMEIYSHASPGIRSSKGGPGKR